MGKPNRVSDAPPGRDTIIGITCCYHPNCWQPPRWRSRTAPGAALCDHHYWLWEASHRNRRSQDA